MFHSLDLYICPARTPGLLEPADAAACRSAAQNGAQWPRLDLLYHFLSCHNKVYFTRKSLFLHIFPSLNEFVLFPFQLFYINFTFAPKSLSVCGRLLCQFFHCFPHRIGRKQEHSAAGVYFHMASYITHFKILHRGSLPYPFFADFWNLFGSMAVLSHSSGTINRIFKVFQNKDRPVPSAEQGGLLHIII